MEVIVVRKGKDKRENLNDIIQIEIVIGDKFYRLYPNQQTIIDISQINNRRKKVKKSFPGTRLIIDVFDADQTDRFVKTNSKTSILI